MSTMPLMRKMISNLGPENELTIQIIYSFLSNKGLVPHKDIPYIHDFTDLYHQKLSLSRQQGQRLILFDEKTPKPVPVILYWTAYLSNVYSSSVAISEFSGGVGGNMTVRRNHKDLSLMLRQFMRESVYKYYDPNLVEYQNELERALKVILFFSSGKLPLFFYLRIVVFRYGVMWNLGFVTKQIFWLRGFQDPRIYIILHQS